MIRSTAFDYTNYTLDEGDKPESVAYYYYDNPEYAWLVLMANDIVDPYTQWYKTTEELELFRVKDIRLDQPFWLRLVGLSNIILVTSDKTSSKYIIPAIKNGTKIREEIRAAVDQRRDEKGVRETDFE